MSWRKRERKTGRKKIRREEFSHSAMIKFSLACYHVVGYPSHCNIFLGLGNTAYGILVPYLGIEPVPPAVKAQSLNHWTIREVPEQLSCFFYMTKSIAKNITMEKNFFLLLNYLQVTKHFRILSCLVVLFPGKFRF